MKKIIYIVVLIVVVLLLLILVSGDSRTKNDGPIEIGFIAPLTGPFSDWGESLQRATILALEDTKHQFDVDFQDTACNSKKAIDAGKKFFDFDNIKVIIGPGCLLEFKPLLPIAIEEDALLLSTGLLDDSVGEEYGTNFINLATQISTEAKFISSYAESIGVDNMSVTHGTDAFGQEFGNKLPEALKAVGIDVPLVEGAPLGTTDLRTVALKLEENDPESLFIYQSERSVGILAKQLRELGSDLKIYGTYTTESESVINSGGSALEGTIYTYPVNSSDGTKEKQDFEKRYKEKFGEDAIPTASSFFVYDGIMILDQAMDKCSIEDTKCIEKFFKEYGSYTGIGGDVIFKEDGSSIRPFGIKTIKDGEFVWIKKDVELHQGLK